MVQMERDSRAHCELNFKVEDNFAGCLQVYNSLSEQEKKWFGKFTDGEKFTVHRKLIEIDGDPAGFIEVGDCRFIIGGIKGDCIIYVAVSAKYRRRGIGFRLVNEVVQNFRENGFKVLTYRVNKNNIASIKLAEKCGLERLPEIMVSESVRKIDYVYATGDIF